MGSSSSPSSSSSSQSYSDSYNTNTAQSINGSGSLGILSQGSVSLGPLSYANNSNNDSNNTTTNQTFNSTLGANSPISGAGTSAPSSTSLAGDSGGTNWTMWGFIALGFILVYKLITGGQVK